MDNPPPQSQRAIETTGVVDEAGLLHLDAPLEGTSPRSVRVIVLFADDEEIDEREWLRATSRNPAFDFLRDPAEDLYSADDGRPFEDDPVDDEDA